MVADALQVDDHIQHGDDDAQVAGHRLLGGDEVDARLFDIVALLVDIAGRRR